MSYINHAVHIHAKVDRHRHRDWSTAELLAAGLTGASYAADASSFLDDKGGPPGTGQLIVALDPAAFGGADAVARFGDLAAMIEAQAGARLPGRRRLALREKARREGLPIADALLLEIENL